MYNPSLTKRRLEVLHLLAKGYSNEEIGKELELSAHTIKAHIGALIRYFKVKSRFEVVTSALKAKIIFIEDL